MICNLRQWLYALTLMGIAPGVSHAAFMGSLTWDADPGVGLNATGIWENTATKLDWEVSENTTGPDAGSWHFKYTWSNPSQGNLSHIIFELSDGVTEDDILNLNIVNANPTVTVGSFGPSSGNPNIPGSLYGIKLDTGNATNPIVLEFDIFRVPTWGDFYAKDGNAGGQGVNTAWNWGFASGESEGLGNDPETSPPANGSLNGHILVPDTESPNGGPQPVPAPPAVVLSVLGLASFGVIGLRRRDRRPQPKTV